MNSPIVHQTEASVPIIRPFVIDGTLPYWARRSHPIVRRHLGSAWKIFVPNFRLLGRLYLVNLVIIGLSLITPGVFALLMPTVTVGLALALPGLLLYASALGQIARASAVYWADERRNDTLALTLALPLPVRHTIYAKMSAALWRQTEHLMSISIGVALFSLPAIVILLDFAVGLDRHPGLTRVWLAAGVGVSIARLWLEPVMVAALGALCGALNSTRAAAATAALCVTAAYYALITLPRYIAMPVELLFVVETIVPVVLPIALTIIAIRLTERALTRSL
jgi:hypothetical protein